MATPAHRPLLSTANLHVSLKLAGMDDTVIQITFGNQESYLAIIHLNFSKIYACERDKRCVKEEVEKKKLLPRREERRKKRAEGGRWTQGQQVIYVLDIIIKALEADSQVLQVKERHGSGTENDLLST